MPYKSFWMGGFEGADHINGKQDRLDMVRGSGHDLHVNEDYTRLADMGIKTVRESVGWRISQPTTQSPLDLSRAIRFAKAAKQHDIQIIWTFMHYGTPDNVSLLDDSFIDHFTAYAKQVAMALAPFSDAPIYNLINEISFLAWATSQTDFMHPYMGDGNSHKGFETKCRLVRAVLSAMAAIKKISPHARFLHVEPIMHFVAPENRPDLEEHARTIRSYQWQTFDLLKGSMCPEFGGHHEALDLIGVNYYYNGQMEVETDKLLCWESKDPRRMPFSELLAEVWDRYERPIIISETGHFGDGREAWLQDVFEEIKVAQDAGTPLEGVCLYPVLDRPCWHEPHKIIRTGLISITDEGRRYHLGSAKTVRRYQLQLGNR